MRLRGKTRRDKPQISQIAQITDGEERNGSAKVYREILRRTVNALFPGFAGSSRFVRRGTTLTLTAPDVQRALDQRFCKKVGFLKCDFTIW